MLKNQCHDYGTTQEWILKDMEFDCNALPECKVTCRGPNKRKIDIVTKECGCISEWLFHSIWLQFSMSCFVFFLLNISRIFFVDGLARVFWRRLHPGTFTVWATCDEKGNFISLSSRSSPMDGLDENDDGNDSDDKSTNFPHPSKSIRMTSNIRNEIDRHSWYFQVGGWFMIAGALLVNAPWIYFIIRESEKMKPVWLLI